MRCRNICNLLFLIIFFFEALPCRGSDEFVIEVVLTAERCYRKTKVGDTLTMHYEGHLDNGQLFDSSYERKEPSKFKIGIGQVIRGFDQGLLDMCVGEKRRLTVPPHLGYGENGAGELIPPLATLYFDVELLNIEDGPAPGNVFKEIDANGDKLLSKEEVGDYLKKQIAQAEASGFKQLPLEDQFLEDTFRYEDWDKNGFISLEEFSGPKHDEL